MAATKVSWQTAANGANNCCRGSPRHGTAASKPLGIVGGLTSSLRSMGTTVPAKTQQGRDFQRPPINPGRRHSVLPGQTSSTQSTSTPASSRCAKA